MTTQNDNPHAWGVLKYKQLTAPILKSTIAEFEDVSVEEIYKTYLTDDEDPKNVELKLLDPEADNNKDLPNGYDILFIAKTPDKYDYDLLIGINVMESSLNLYTRRIENN